MLNAPYEMTLFQRAPCNPCLFPMKAFWVFFIHELHQQEPPMPLQNSMRQDWLAVD